MKGKYFNCEMLFGDVWSKCRWWCRWARIRNHLHLWLVCICVFIFDVFSFKNLCLSLFDQNAAGDAAEKEIRNHLNPCLYFSSTNLLISLFIFLHIISGDAAVQEIRNHLHPQFVPLHITTKKDFQFPKKKIASHHNKTNFRFPKKKISSHHKERGFSISRRNKTKLG